MNVFSKIGFKIGYTTLVDRFSASKDDEEISFTSKVLAVIVANTGSQTKSERIFVQQHGSHIKAIKEFSNFMISFRKEDVTSSLTIKYDIVHSLVSKFDVITASVNKTRKKSESPHRGRIKG